VNDPPGADARPAALPDPVAAALVFIASGAVLVLEILALRLVAPYVGVTLQTSTAVIGVALTGIAVGAWAGGRTADMVDPRSLLAPAFLLAGAGTLLVLPMVRWVGATATGPEVGSVLLVATVAVLPPVVLLSAIPPLVVKLQLGSLARTGSVVGRYSGIGTVGAIVATFVTGFLLVAALPTSAIVVAVGLLLLAIGGLLLVASWRSARRTRLLGGSVAALLGVGLTVSAPSPCQIETAYHCARVVVDPARPTGRVLELDTLRHSYVDRSDPTYLDFTYIETLGSLLDVHRPPGAPLSALHLGGGGMTLPRYLAATRPGSRSLVYEIDGGVVELNRTRMPLPADAGITVEVQDARIGLTRENAGSRDVVVGDAFGGLSVPWHLTTAEVARQVARALRPGGVYAVNVIDYPPSAFARAEVATLRSVFPFTAVVATPESLAGRGGGNFVLLASAAPLPLDALRERLAERGTPVEIATRDRLDAFVGDARILTDDFAPVDQLLLRRS
jgi:spermidine synthase